MNVDPCEGRNPVCAIICVICIYIKIIAVYYSFLMK